MTPEAFLREFGTLAEAEGGVGRLRNAIYQLAVAGRLVCQDPADAAVDSPSVKSLPGALPRGWAWLLPDALAASARHALTIGPFGSSLLKADYRSEGVPLVFVREITARTFGGAKTRYVSPAKAEELAAHTVRSGDLLITKMGSPPGDTAIYPDDRPPGIITADCVKLTPNPKLVMAQFLQIAIESPMVRARIVDITKGVAHQKISLARFREIPLPVAPLPEQKRIVEKVDQLMALCDDLEAAQKKRRETSFVTNKAVLSAVTSASGTRALKESWKRVQDNFEVLYDAPENVQELRQTILQLAVMGKLVRQDPRDEPAKLGIVDRPGSTALERLTESERLPGYPSAWIVERLGFLADVASGVTKGRKLAGRRVISLPYLRVANVQRGHLDLSLMKEIEIAEGELDRYKLAFGDVVLTEGGDWDKLGRSAVWRSELDLCLHQNHVFRARFDRAVVLPEWASIFTNSPVGRAYFESAAKQTTNLASINMTQLRNCPIPVPPVAEQRRILLRLDQLMALCDDLDARLQKSRANGEALMKAVVEHLVAAPGTPSEPMAMVG